MIDLDFDASGAHDALLRQADFLCNALENRIREKLSGEVLNTRSGALTDSISSFFDDEGSAVSVAASSGGVPYAAIHEFGGKSAAHDIVAVKAKALAFSVGSGEVFAKRVRHPGSTIPARSYLRSALAEMRDEITTGWKQAVLESLGRA